MEKLEKLKCLIYQIIDENVNLSNMLDFIEHRGDKLPTIKLEYQKGSCLWDNSIIIGLTDVIECYNLTKDFFLDLKSKIEPNYYYYNNKKINENCHGIIIEMPKIKIDDVEERIIQSDFLSNDEMLDICDAIAVYSLAYSLYHEFGHVFLNEYIPESEPKTRETAVDTYAFKAIKSLCEIENDNVLLMGVFISIINILQNQIKNDDRHPHSITRLYTLLNFWGLQEESQFWNIAYDVVYKWGNQNSHSIIQEGTTPVTKKDKFINAYLYLINNAILSN